MDSFGFFLDDGDSFKHGIRDIVCRDSFFCDEFEIYLYGGEGIFDFMCQSAGELAELLDVLLMGLLY